ncbi:MAG TPA: maleylpyruvate isomerase N-terminal domain-containing protein [Nonomuraea sp.]|nr:maleylpyruvate isomerase N-terminal domain-containing protein [Nonomuraea sp.]
MDWTVAGVVAHISECLLWYSTDLVAGDRELSTMDMRVRSDSSPADLIATLNAFATVLARVIDGAPPRGWHPYGLADASGLRRHGL